MGRVNQKLTELITKRQLLQIENFSLTNLEHEKTGEIYEEINAIIELTNQKSRIKIRVEGISEPIELKKQKLFRTLTDYI